VTDKLKVGISEFRVARAPQVLTSYGLGSCVGIMLYDAELKLGGLAHTLLPELRPGMPEQRPGKFVTLAIRQMLQDLLEQGAARSRIIAKICGGAHMFQPPPDDLSRTIGQRNVLAARETLEELGIRLLGEDVGGSYGRTVEFDLENGEVLLRFVRGKDQLKTL
jgi:chemotaxis protein CheD